MAAARRPSRVDAIDAARGLALIGMMLAHLGPVWINRNPPLGHVIVSGRAAPLFALLAGVALTLVHRRDPHGAGAVGATVVRGVVLIAIGLGLGSLDDMPVYVILAFYGLMVIVALPFRDLSTRSLVALATVWSLVSGVVVIGIEVSHDLVEAKQAQLSDLKNPAGLLEELIVFGAYPTAVWFSYVLVGLVVGRLELQRAVVAGRLAALGATLLAAAFAVGGLLIGVGALDDPSDQGWRLLFVRRSYPYEPASWDDLLLLGEHTSTPLNVVASIGSALLVIGLCALVVGVPWGRWLLLPLRSAGAMTLTLYTAHVLWFWRIVKNHDDAQGFPASSYRDWFLQVVVLCGFAVVWQRLLGRGPLETVMRWVSVTWWRRIVRSTWLDREEKKNAPVDDRGVDSGQHDSRRDGR